MKTIKKSVIVSELSRELGIHKATISDYIRRGILYYDDEKNKTLDFENSLKIIQDLKEKNLNTEQLQDRILSLRGDLLEIDKLEKEGKIVNKEFAKIFIVEYLTEIGKEIRNFISNGKQKLAKGSQLTEKDFDQLGDFFNEAISKKFASSYRNARKRKEL